MSLRFSMRGCGDSEGEFARVICLEQVEDTRNALSFLASHPAVDPKRIAVVGSSFGGAVAVYTGGVDERVAAVISNGGWGDVPMICSQEIPVPRSMPRVIRVLIHVDSGTPRDVRHVYLRGARVLRPDLHR